MLIVSAHNEIYDTWLYYTYAIVEVPITDHLRDFALDPEKYKVVQIFRV
jgi:hypothetical protein